MSTTDERPVAPPPARSRVAQTVWDMVRSLAVVAAVVGVTLVFVPGLLHPSKSQRVPAVQWADKIPEFRDLSGHAATAPVGLPAGWHVNAVAITGTRAAAHLHLGWVTPDGNYAGLEEGTGPAPEFLTSVLGKPAAVVAGSVTIDGRPWQRRTSQRGEEAITRTSRGVTVVITGSASSAQLAQLAASLR